MEREYSSPCNITTGWITVNTGCNNRCKWCYRKTDLLVPARSMSRQLSYQVVDFFNLIGVDSVIFIGGEPTLYKELPDLIRVSRSSGVKECVVVTNGRKLSNIDYTKQLSESGVDVFSVTIYSAHKNVHNAVTKVSSWDETSRGIKNIVKLGKKVSLNVVVGPNNYNTTVESVREFVDWGVNEVIVSCSLPYIDGEDFIGDASLDPKLFADLTARLINTPNNVFVLFELPLCLLDVDVVRRLTETNKLHYGCHVGLGSGIVIDVDGKVLPCNSFANAPLFEINRKFVSKEEFYKFWNYNNELVEFRNEVNVLRSNYCYNCSLWQICNCGCPLLWGVYDPDKYINHKLANTNYEFLKKWFKLSP